MKKLSTKNAFASVVMACILFLFLEGCKKEIQINNPAGAAVNLALAKSNIIYTDINPDTTRIGKNYRSHYYRLDLNNDDTADFEIEAYNYHDGHMFAPTHCGISISSFNKSRVACDSSSAPLEMNLGDTVSSNLNWVHTYSSILRGMIGFTNTFNIGGNWATTADHYLGLKIKSGNNTYYGWVRMSVSVSTSPTIQSSVTIKDYAYNSIQNQRILAGQRK